MINVSCTLVSTAPLSQSAPIQSAKQPGESHEAYEERTWRERLHVDQNGMVYIPPTALKNALSEAAKYRGDTIPGKGKSTYTKHFEAGIMVMHEICLGVPAAAIEREKLFVPASGVRGDGKRVWKNFPLLKSWRAEVNLVVLDPVLCDKNGLAKVQEYLDVAGQFIGMGRFRPRNNGYYGRFKVEKFTYTAE